MFRSRTQRDRVAYHPSSNLYRCGHLAKSRFRNHVFYHHNIDLHKTFCLRVCIYQTRASLSSSIDHSILARLSIDKPQSRAAYHPTIHQCKYYLLLISKFQDHVFYLLRTLQNIRYHRDLSHDLYHATNHAASFHEKQFHLLF